MAPHLKHCHLHLNYCRTLATQLKDSLHAVLAIEDVHGVFAFVLLSGLIDVEPQPISSDPRLDSL